MVSKDNARWCRNEIPTIRSYQRRGDASRMLSDRPGQKSRIQPTPINTANDTINTVKTTIIVLRETLKKHA